MSSSSSSKVSKKPVNKKTATPIRGPFGQRYDPETGSLYRDFPRIVRSADPGSPPSMNPPVPNTIPKSFDRQKTLQNTAETYQQEWHASVRDQIINHLLHLNPPGLPSQAKLQGLSSLQLARWAIPTLTAADPTGVITGTASTDPTTMEELVTALQNTAATTYSKNQILAHLTAQKQKLNDNFEAQALNYVDEFPPLPSSPQRDYGPMNAVEAAKLSSKRPYQPTPLELIGSSQSKRHSSVSVSAATVGVSSSIPAKQRNPGQRQIVPTKHFGDYHGSDKITQLATDILPGACLIAHLIAHLQDQYACCNVDALLSRTDIMYLAHVGGVLQPTIINHDFVSDLFNVFRGDNVSHQLATLVSSGLPILLVTVPNPLSKLASTRHWVKYYEKPFNLGFLLSHCQYQCQRTLSVLSSTFQSQRNA
jgi:hypothetical protein